MIILRNDDVLLPTPTEKLTGKEFDRYRFINKMCNETTRLMHQPTILCTEIMDFPEAIEYTREEWKAGRMFPELHGWEHKDYVHKSETEIRGMLKKSQDWFEKHLHRQFDMWATPWGGYSDTARDVADEMGITLETVEGLLSVGKVVSGFRTRTDPMRHYRDTKILFHWWNKGNNFGRLAEILKHGSYEAAKEADERGWF